MENNNFTLLWSDLGTALEERFRELEQVQRSAVRKIMGQEK